MLDLFFKAFSGCFVNKRRAEGWDLKRCSIYSLNRGEGASKGALEREARERGWK